MKLFFIRFRTMLKRTLCQPVYIIMLLAIIILSTVYVMIPAEKKSLYVSAAILCEDDSPEAKEFLKSINDRESVFTFYQVDDIDELKEDIISGKANSGFVIPKNYISDSMKSGYSGKITEYVTSGSFLPSVAFEEVYVNLFSFTSYEALIMQLEKDYESTDEMLVEIRDVYDNYNVTDRLFNANMSYDEYATLTKDNKTELPIRKILGLFIFIAAVLGTAAYITDRENNIYLVMGKAERVSLRFIHILVSVLPLAVTGYFVMLILNEMTPLKSALHILMYMVLVAFVSLAFGLFFKKSSSFYKFLPILLVLNMILSGVFFDLGKYNDFALYLARLCPPYYF